MRVLQCLGFFFPLFIPENHTYSPLDAVKCFIEECFFFISLEFLCRVKISVEELERLLIADYTILEASIGVPITTDYFVYLYSDRCCSTSCCFY